MHPSDHCSTIYNSQVMEDTQMSINRGMYKDVIHIYNVSHKKGCNNAICRDLETVIHSEVSQKDKYCIVSLICGIKKNG